MFESGARVQDSLQDLAGIMGERDAAICREMTKLHEEVRRATLAELAAISDTLETRGEFVLVVGRPRQTPAWMTPRSTTCCAPPSRTAPSRMRSRKR
jgi:16S rRNA C1402 (ribose-2'-O) methylase RsmI